MPDAAGLELIAQRVRDRVSGDGVVGTSYFRDQATLELRPGAVPEVLRYLKGEGDEPLDEEPFDFLAGLYGCDYFPEEPRLGVHYELLGMHRAERMRIKTRVTVEEPEVPSVIGIFPTADFQERETFDFFGVIFTGHPDLRRTHMPEDYEGHPQRRDYPIGGEPVLFTFNENKLPRWYD